ncbi:hypothetical protein HHK36_021145 [Tetracentron sinense]|uniref:DDE Tnp4 domain-containing protein n=1 Tax=Tetracentron sinense TaxID=13715 RepID=A0A834YSK5_TETSI|nr:hypothetical protein HHK36_021145 [Tetracentron sinense]
MAVVHTISKKLLCPYYAIREPRWSIDEDCVGAIDGSYIPTMVKIEDQPRYHTRKRRIAQNVMAAVGFDMKFTYVLAGWEGFARDPKVLRATIRDAPTKLLIPVGNPIAF